LPAPSFKRTCGDPGTVPPPEESENESQITESSAEAISRIDSSETFAYRSVVRVEACPIAFAIFWRLIPRLARLLPKVCLRSLRRQRRSIFARTFALAKARLIFHTENGFPSAVVNVGGEVGARHRFLDPERYAGARAD
jgi:hypothetical protein